MKEDTYQKYDSCIIPISQNYGRKVLTVVVRTQVCQGMAFPGSGQRTGGHGREEKSQGYEP